LTSRDLGLTRIRASKTTRNFQQHWWAWWEYYITALRQEKLLSVGIVSVQIIKLKSDNSAKLAILFIWFCLKYDFTITGVTHIPGSDNISADWLSRGGAVHELFGSDARLGVVCVELVIDCGGILELCDPRLEVSSDLEFTTLWNQIPGCFERVLTGVRRVVHERR
jgi:hypothetical protein